MTQEQQITELTAELARAEGTIVSMRLAAANKVRDLLNCLATTTAERDDLRFQVARLRPVVDAAVACIAPQEYSDCSEGNTGRWLKAQAIIYRSAQLSERG